MFSIVRLTLRSASLHLPLRHFVLCLLALCLAASSASAQLAGTGAISGTVQDPTGAIIPGATVVALNAATNIKTTRTTTGSGDFNISPLIPGEYTVTITAPGFQTTVQQHVTVDALATVAVNVQLTIGAADQSITISSAPPLLSTTDATLGAVMDNEMYSNLPILMGQGGNNDQRRATDFEYLMPGVQANYTSNNSTDNTGSVNGSGPAGGVSEVYIDGVNLSEADQVGDPRFVWTSISVDAVNQLQVQTTGQSAQYAGQGVENFSVKTGGNAIHGSVYEFLRNTALDAWPFTSKVPTLNSQGVLVPGGIKPKEIQNEYGIVISGPIVKNKLFLFYNYGQYRNATGAHYGAITIPTAAMLGLTQAGAPLGYADFSGYAAANPGYHIYDPATQTPDCAGTAASPCLRSEFMGLKNGVPTADVIPASRLSKSSQYFNQFFIPYEQLASQTTYANNLNFGRPTGLSNWYQTGRLDYTQNAKNQVSIIVAFGRQSDVGTNSVGASELGPPFNTSQNYAPQTTVDMVKDVFTINDHLVNQFAAAFGRYRSLSTTPDVAPIYSSASSGLLNTPAGQASTSFPEIQFSGGVDLPGATNNSGTYAGYSENLKVNNTYTVVDSLQWVFGKHNMTFGGQVSELQFNYYKSLTPTGPMDYTFSNSQTAAFTAANGQATTLSTTTGSSVASYELGAANAGTIPNAEVPGLGSRWLDPSFWFEDDYKVSEKLTLNLGVRWDIWPAIHEAHNIFSFLNPTGLNSVTGNQGTLEFAGNGAAGLYCNCKNPSPTDYKNVAPRLGMAYSVDPKTVVRASYGLSFARGNWTSGTQAGSPSTLGLTPSATAPAGIVGAPSFYWDATQCANGTADSVACGWTGNVTAPVPPAGGTSLAEYATTETTALGQSGSGTISYYNPRLGSRTPEFGNWSVGVQRQITRDMSLTVSYVGSQGHFISISKAVGSRNNALPLSLGALAGYNVVNGTAVPCSGAACTGALLTAKSTAANLALATGLGFTPPNPYNPSNATYYASNAVYQYYQPFPQYSGVSDSTSFVGNSAYHALQLTLRQRSAHGLDFMLNYTYSKAIDDLGTFRSEYNDRLDRSLSTTDEPQNLTATAVYASPFGKGKMMGENRLVRGLAGGWNLSGIFTYHSGYPLLFTGTSCGTAGILNQCMPSIVPGQAGRKNGNYGRLAGNNTATTYSQAQYLNPAAFTVATTTSVGNGPALYVPGNAPRTAALNVWGMGYYDLDASLKRIFPIYEQFKLQFEADMANVTNHVVWASPSGAVGSGNFGTLSGLNSQNSPRAVQLAGRIIW